MGHAALSHRLDHNLLQQWGGVIGPGQIVDLFTFFLDKQTQIFQWIIDMQRYIVYVHTYFQQIGLTEFSKIFVTC